MSFFKSIPAPIQLILILAGAVAFISIIVSLIGSFNKDYGTCQEIGFELSQINNKEGMCYSINKAALRISIKNTGSTSIHSFVYITESPDGRDESVLTRSRLGTGKSFELEAPFARDKNPTVRLIPRVETEDGVINCEDKSMFKANIQNC